MKSQLSIGLIAALATAMAGPSWSAPAPEGPLTLDRALEIALAQNPQVAVAGRQVEVARSRIGQARAQSKTTLDFSGRYTRQGPTIGFTVPGPGGVPVQEEIVPPDSHSLNLHAQRVIYSGGRLWRAPLAASHAVSATQFDQQAARESVALQVKRAYFGVLKARRFAEVAQDAVKQSQEHLRISNVQFKAGAVAKFDVIRSEVELANAQQQLVEATSGTKIAEAAFNNALSRPLETPVDLAPAATRPEFKADVGKCLEVAEASRPEVRSLDANTAAAEQQLAIARAGKKPTVVVSGDYNRKVSTAFGEDFDWNATLSVQLPLFDGKLTKSTTQEAAATVAQLGDSRQQLVEGIGLQVKSAHLNCDQSYRRIATATKAIEQANEALRIVRLQYQNGLATNVDVTDAELALTQAKMNEARAIYDYYLALADLERAVGLTYAEIVQAQEGAPE